MIRFMLVLTGFTFGVGLFVAQMTKPSKIVGFLDFFGSWDPSLLLVMVGALATHIALYRIVLRRQTPVFAESFDLPKNRVIDRRLVIGSVLFGMGWALAGFCPGPALVSAATLSPRALLFVVAMVAGMGLFEVLLGLPKRSKQVDQPRTVDA
ncbi:MAG: DUF6691 family protein [Polyangiaceae bacterium]